MTKDQFGFSLGSLSYVDSSYDDGYATTVQPQKHRFGKRVAVLCTSIVEWQRRRAVMQEMALMTDRELSDIGLSRSDLSRVFDPGFASDHARGRDYIAY